MRIEAGLQLRQEMRMKLAPQIIQSIEILQLPLMELRQRIDQELQENPLLEQSEIQEQAEDQHSEPPDTPATDVSKDGTPKEVTIEGTNEAQQYERLADLTRYYDDFSQGSSPRRASSGERDAKQEAFENSPAPDVTLGEHLTQQLAYLDVDDRTRRICESIIANLDGRGYLGHPLDEIAASAEVAASAEEAEEALKIIQSLEPPGVAARSVEECLVLQLDKGSADYEFLARLIGEHFADLLQNRYPKVARAMGCPMEELRAAVETIGKLDPLPASLFESRAVPHVLPDVRVDEVDGEYIVTLEDTWLPSLRVSAYYARRLQQKDLDPKTREYLQRKLQSAQLHIAAIEQRRTTLQRVATEIVDVQKEFLDKGSMYLKPLKMQDVADVVSVHVSTVSRAISDKHVQTPRGMYPLKYFFTGGVAKEDGEMESWEVVRQKLLELVNKEDKHNPLSDEQIAEQLAAQGIEIARRTVSKYRKTLDIPSSRLRKLY